MPKASHEDSSGVPDEHRVQRPGGWLPEDHRLHNDWLAGTAKHVDENPKDFHPVIKEFQDLIEGSTRLYMFAQGMFDEVPEGKHPYNKDPSGQMSIRGYKHMLAVMNHLLSESPGWSNYSHQIGLVGLPVFALLDWPMGTSNGFAFFLDPQVNAMLKKVLNVWGEYLQSPESRKCLSDSDSGWFGETGRKDLTTVANLGDEKNGLPFEKLFQCDPKAEYHGYKSWDDFFTRQFHWENRPVAEPDNQNVIVSSCESKPYRVAHDVKRRDKFWVKGMPYSVLDILNHDELAEQFVGGTIYQAFLSALSYHRWHTPVDGTVKKVVIVDGTYYSEPLFEDFGRHPGGANMEGTSEAQAYLTATATRALIFIEADNPAIGLLCVVQVGMSEVSSCDVTVKEGQKLKKGDEIGMFHFGGSTYCLMFRKGVKVSGFPDPNKVSQNVPVRSKIAVVEG